MSADQALHWLHPLLGDEPSASLLVGGVGHLLLNREEEAVVTAALEARVLPLLRDMAAGRPITLFTGLAPGADLLLMDRASHWCTRNKVPLRMVGLCAVPIPQLIEDWVLSAEAAGYTLSRADHLALIASVNAAVASCHAVLPFYTPELLDSWLDPVHRQQRYQQLAAVLVEYADVLVAVLHEEHLGQPGGTAEVVSWRQEPARIPPQYATRPARRKTPQETGLIIVNPMPAKVTMSASGGDLQAKKVLAAAEAASKAGNELLANDLLYHALKQGLRHPDLNYLRVRALAGIGSNELALSEYHRLAPTEGERDERWLTLLGRIKKDQGLRNGARRYFTEAASAYLQAWEQFRSSYALINAATLLTLGHDWPHAHGLAKKVLALIDSEPADDDESCYYAAATAAEAALILGDHTGVSQHLKTANDLLPLRAPQRSRTLRQLKRLCRALRVSTAVLAPLQLPPLILLRRLGFAELTPNATFDPTWIADLPVSSAIFMGVCDSFDLLLAEALLSRGQNLQLVLPYRAERIIEATRSQLGEGWAVRLERCLQAAANVHAERGFLEAELDWAASNVTERALGLSLLAAQHLGSELHIIDINPLHLPPSTASAPVFPEDHQRSRQALAHLYSLEPANPPPQGRRMVGLIFADFAGFQRLEDRDLPYFWQGLMRGIGQLLRRHGEAILLRHTWGDALHVVTADASTAAGVMADIQQYLELNRLKPDAPLAGLELRIAGHYAPAYEGHDPIHAARTYYGTQLSLTARIEPVTPPGQIYATAAFAARLAVEDSEHFALEYTGEIELAKRFGAYRLYSLRRLRN